MGCGVWFCFHSNRTSLFKNFRIKLIRNPETRIGKANGIPNKKTRKPIMSS